MWRKKSFIIVAALTVLVLGATLGSVAMAQADDENSTDNASSFLEKVAEVYQTNTGVAIDPEALQQAITEARQTLRDEALDNYLQELVDNGTITQAQADEFKAWLDAKPDLPVDEFQEWWNARPDMPGLFGNNNGTGMGPLGRMHRAFKVGEGIGFRLGTCR